MLSAFAVKEANILSLEKSCDFCQISGKSFIVIVLKNSLDQIEICC